MSMGYRHHVPGRLRLRTQRIKNQPAAAAAVEQLMGSVPGVLRSQANTLTGSVTVHYDPAETSVDAVIQMLHANGYTHHCALPERRTPRRNRPDVNLAGQVASRIAGVLAEKALERAVALLIVAAL